MNPFVRFSRVIGLLLAISLLPIAMFHSTSTPIIFFNVVGALIVMGGLSACAIVIFPINEIKLLVANLRETLFGHRLNFPVTILECIQLAELQTRDQLSLSKGLEIATSDHLRDGMELLAMGLKQEEIKQQLEQRTTTVEESIAGEVSFLLSLAKLGPGFGLLGTLVGLVVMLGDMGSGGGFDKVGPALAISLLATLYGIITANMFLQPLAEALNHHSEHLRRHANIVAHAVSLIKDRKHPIQIREALKSFLDRDDYPVLEELFTYSRKRRAEDQEPPPPEQREAA